MIGAIKKMIWEHKAKLLLAELSAKFQIDLPGKVEFRPTGLPGQKAYTYDRDGQQGMVIDLGQHSSYQDVEWSVYHEFRHMMQYGFLDTAYICRCRSLTRDRNWYLFSPMEIDARVFAKTKGQIADKQVFEAIGDMDTFPSSRSFLYHCMAVSRKYGVG